MKLGGIIFRGGLDFMKKGKDLKLKEAIAGESSD
jgi:hypothetical protein